MLFAMTTSSAGDRACMEQRSAPKNADSKQLPNHQDANPTHLTDRAFGIHLVPEGTRRSETPIRRRQVIYIAGYDPRPPEEAARRILARETERMAARTGIAASLSPVLPGRDEHEARWVLEASCSPEDRPPWSIETDFLYLRWDDLVAPDFARPFVRRAVRSLGTLLDYVFSGALFRMLRSYHPTVFLWLYPPLAVVLLILAAIWLGTVAQFVAEDAGGWPSGIAGMIGAASALGVFALGRFAVPFGYWGHLMELWIFCRDYAVGARPDVEDRVRLFAGRIAEAAAASDYDETLIIGHSFGCMLAAEATGEARLRAPEAFRQGAPVALVNVASCAGTSLLRRTSETTRRRMIALAETSDMVWLEIQGKQDLINYYRVDPMVMAGIDDDPARPNPVIRGLSLKDLVSAQTYRRIRKDFFRNHHQTIMANDHHYPWELPRLLAGPTSVTDVAQGIVLKYLYWFGRDAEAQKIVGGKAPD